MKLIIIAHSEDLGTPEINTFHSEDEALAHLYEMLKDEYGVNIRMDQSVGEYIEDYYSWVREMNDNCCEVTVAYEIFEY